GAGEGEWGYSLSVDVLRTDNDLPANSYESRSYSGRVQVAATPDLTLGATFRAMDGDYESVGSRNLYSPGLARSTNYLATFYADWTPSSAVTFKARSGLHHREYLWIAPVAQSDQVNHRVILEGQAAWRPSEALELVAGASSERSVYEINDE